MNKRLLATAVSCALAAPTAVQAVKYKLSGQINRSVVFMDDGVQSDVRHVDSIESGTRVRLRGSEDLGNGMKVGFYWELQTSSNPSNQAFPDQNSDGNQNTNQIRHANVWFSGNWGRLQIGQGDGAGNGATEVDLSGTATVLYHGRTSHTGAITWRTSGGGQLRDPATGNVLRSSSTFNEFDAFSRYDNVRYDSPALGPVTLSGSIGNDNKWEVAGRISTALVGGQLSGAVFYGENDQAATGDGGIDARYGGSVSYLFSQGTNITGVYARNEPEVGDEADVWTVKLGHKWGPHSVAVLYGEASDVTPGFDDVGFGIGYNHALKKANTELYAGYLHQELDDTPTGTPSVEDIDVFIVGARVKFD